MKKVLKKLKNVEGIEKIIWAYSGVKKCSDLKIKDEKIIPVLNSLGLEYDGKFIKSKGWPSWNSFAKKYQRDDDYMFDFVTGLFYDIPFCCAETYHAKVIEFFDKFLYDYPFEGKSTLKDVLELLEDPNSSFEDFNSFSKKFRKHEKLYDFEKNYDEVQVVKEEVLQRIFANKLPESMFLLLGLTYVPCKANCKKFLTQSEEMFKSLKSYLGNKQSKQILRKYQGKVR